MTPYATQVALVSALGHPVVLIGFIVNQCGVWLGPLRRTPEWLQRSARLAMANHYDEVARLLVHAAGRERHLQRLRSNALVAQRELWPNYPPVNLLVSPTLAARLHARLRFHASQDPLAMVTVEYELAAVSLWLGTWLSTLAEHVLGRDAEPCMGFVQLALSEARQHHPGYRDLRDQLVARYPEREPQWSARAHQVVDSYLELLLSCTHSGSRGPATTPPMPPQRSLGPQTPPRGIVGACSTPTRSLRSWPSPSA